MKTALQVCFCGPRDDEGNPVALPLQPLGKHSFGCLVWDYAMSERLITPSERLGQLDEYDRSLGCQIPDRGIHRD